MAIRWASLKRALLGERPRMLLVLIAPTGLAVGLDLALRGRTLAGYATQGKLIYGSSLLVSAAFWTFPRDCEPFAVGVDPEACAAHCESPAPARVPG